MAVRAGLVLLLLLGVIAMGWLLGGDEPPGPDATEGEVAPARAPDATAPQLAVRPPARATAAASRPVAGPPASALPAWLRGFDWLRLPLVSGARGNWQRLRAWMDEDPRHVLAFVRHLAARMGKQSLEVVYVRLRGLFRTYMVGWAAQVAAPLAHALASPEEDERVRAATLGALAGLEDSEIGAVERLLIDLLCDEREALALRFIAGRTLLILGSEDPALVAGYRSLLRSALQQEPSRLLGELAGIASLGARAGPAVPALLEIEPALGERVPGADRVVFKILLGARPIHPTALARIVEAMGSEHADLRAMALNALLDDGLVGVDALLEILATGNAVARVTGVGRLRTRGVPRARLEPILLPALLDEDRHVREQAVGLLPTIAVTVEAVMPYVDQLMASRDPERWLIAVRAVGGLTQAEGDLDAPLRILHVAARLPDTRVRAKAVQVMLMFDDRIERIVPLLADLLRDTEVAVRCEAVDGLGELSAHHASARAALRAAEGDGDDRVRELAAYWLESTEADDGR